MNEQAKQYNKMTATPIKTLILSLGLPTTISMLVTNIYNMADTFFVSRIGTSASGAIGIVFGLMAILQAFGFMFGHGAGSNISRRLGAKRVQEARLFSATSFYLSILLGVIIMILGLLFMDPLMYLLGSTKTILPYARTYAFYILIGGPAMTSSCVMNNILRYEGKAAFAMIGLTSGSLINIFGDAFFMNVFHMGIAGAGLSTALSQYISALILLSMFLRGRTQSRFYFRDVCLKSHVLGSIIAVGFPSLCRQGLTSVSTMILNSQAGAYGDSAIAAISIVARITNFIFSVGLGVGQGFQPVAAFNYGAKQYKRVRDAFFFTLSFSMTLLVIFSIAGYFFSGNLIRIFRDDPEVIKVGVLAMRLECFALVLMPLSLCGNMLFQSIGKAKEATFLACMRSGFAFIPLVILLPRLFGLLGLQMAQPLGDAMASLAAIPFLIHFFHVLPKENESLTMS